MSLRGMIASVGGAPRPLVESLVMGKPSYVLFIVSEDSKSQVDDRIRPELAKMLQDYYPQYESLAVSDHQNIGTCYREIRTGIKDWLHRRELKPEEVYIDFTGATKAMSAALTLAAIEDFSQFRYVGGSERSGDGLGTVITGTEKIVEIQNPWDTYAVRELERANWLLEGFHADAAGQVLEKAARKCSPELKARMEAYAGLAGALGRADCFDFKKAHREFNHWRQRLELCLEYPFYQRLVSLNEHWKTVGDQVKHNDQTAGRETLLELLANAERRAEQSRFDDAVGRLYRAVELRGQQLVRQTFGADLGKVSIGCFPVVRRQEVIEKLGQPDDGLYKLGVRNLFQILEFSEDRSLGEKARIYDRIKDHLQKRNSSLLAHGSLPVRKESFESFWESSLSVLGVCDSDIPRWPKLILKLQLER